MRKSSPVLICLCLLALSPFVFAQQNHQKAEQAAEQQAQSWLKLVDSGNYANSWNEAAGYFRDAISSEKWVQSLNAVRAPLGKLESRKLSSAQYATTLPGAPDGEYVVLKYSTSFQNKKSATETLTMRLDEGQWRAVGYFIR